jgi:hypothetical protein
MSNDLTVLQGTKNALAAAAQEESGSVLGGKLLKFSKGHYLTGDDKIPAGREYIAYPTKWVRGWTKFYGGRLIEQRVGSVSDGFVVPERDELGDNDPTQWEKDASGKARDQWQKQSYLPLEDLETGEILIFVSGSHGGRGAISKMVSVAAKNLENGEPRVRLGVGSYKHKSFGRVEVPEFIITGWSGNADRFDDEGDEGGAFDDSVPFNDGSEVEF